MTTVVVDANIVFSALISAGNKSGLSWMLIPIQDSYYRLLFCSHPLKYRK